MSWHHASHAWVPFGSTWNGAAATVSLNLNVNDPPDQAGVINPWNAVAEDALARWNAVPGSSFRFFFDNTDANECDGQVASSNAAEWGDNSTCGGGFLGPDTLAVTIRFSDPVSGQVTNADVLFNRTFSWTSADPGFTTQEPINFNSVAMHEFGHVLGLGHENDQLAVMNSIYHPNPQRFHADDRLGVRSRYPGSGSETDVAPSNWKKTIPGADAAVLVASPRSAVAGEAISIEWTQENLGTTDASFNVGFFLSTDNVISPGHDTLLAKSFGAFQPAGTSDTFSRTLKIPSGTPQGIYFLGLCLDDDNFLAENAETNNCLAHPRTLFVSTQPTERLINISTRGAAETGDNVMIGGFIIGGTAAKTVLIRGRGPSMGGTPFFVPGSLANPFLRLFSGQTVIAQNDNWQDSPACNPGFTCGGAAQISATGVDPCQPNPGQATPPSGCTQESAILITLLPGAYTAILSGVGGASGIGLVEVFEIGGASDPVKLINISTRARVQTGDGVMIGGFIIGGTTQTTVLIRARGRSMASAPFLVPGTLLDPFLQIFSGQTVIAQNDDWQDSPICNPGFSCDGPTEITATGLDPCEPNPGQATSPPGCALESAMLITLPPGAYTAIVSGVGGGTGVGLMEVFEVD